MSAKPCSYSSTILKSILKIIFVSYLYEIWSDLVRILWNVGGSHHWNILFQSRQHINLYSFRPQIINRYCMGKAIIIHNSTLIITPWLSSIVIVLLIFTSFFECNYRIGRFIAWKVSCNHGTEVIVHVALHHCMRTYVSSYNCY